jgi:hypothetical protein
MTDLERRAVEADVPPDWLRRWLRDRTIPGLAERKTVALRAGDTQTARACQLVLNGRTDDFDDDRWHHAPVGLKPGRGWVAPGQACERDGGYLVSGGGLFAAKRRVRLEATPQEPPPASERVAAALMRSNGGRWHGRTARVRGLSGAKRRPIDFATQEIADELAAPPDRNRFMVADFGVPKLDDVHDEDSLRARIEDKVRDGFVLEDMIRSIRRGAPTQTSREDRAETARVVCELRREGVAAKMLAEVLECSRSTIRNLCKSHERLITTRSTYNESGGPNTGFQEASSVSEFVRPPV